MCVVCHHSLKDTESLKTHVKLHAIRPKWQCLICDRICTGFTRLRVHVQTHVCLLHFMNHIFCCKNILKKNSLIFTKTSYFFFYRANEINYVNSVERHSLRKKTYKCTWQRTLSNECHSVRNVRKHLKIIQT